MHKNCGEHMIEYEIKKNPGCPAEFSYDLKALALDFYPEKKCEVREREDWADREGYPLVCRIDGEEALSVTLPAGYNKNTVKACLYQMFSDRTGITLPWGILTGIRPAKIPLRLMWKQHDRKEIEEILRREYWITDEKIRLAVDVAEKEEKLTGLFNHENGYNIYIGIPFCPTICQYCSFSSFPYSKYKNLADEYLSALEKEMKFAGDYFSSRELHTVYVGGGTPTALNEEQMERLLWMIRTYLPMEQAAEFTVEAGRPDSITAEKLRLMKRAGVTRISINPQTMKQRTLDLLGRRHSVEQVVNSFYMARSAGFDNINMDLIVGLPEENETDFQNTLDAVREMNPDSVTVHTLVIKRASRMRREQMESGGEIHPEDTLVPRLQTESGEYLRKLGYEPYYMYRQKNKAGTTRNTNQENVAYARPGKECLYNIFIMEELETIVALGCGGSTKQVFHSGNRMERIENIKGVEEYIARIDEMIERKRMAFAEDGW
jgi:oxygen-independent coproporphyrinogen-3 oxidase